ncbi:MAG: hydroxymethylglutaryl-CoA reductase, degradative [Flavobacteriaceae bacterium]|nr:hydroxymethylglutaryl-CoA reductase, degradative [Flavobacteriaceae bacterium]|tara:strand:- start:15972 stop:17282 length:1311 start_codon:yes stop_codon:yes gene_type:complete
MNNIINGFSKLTKEKKIDWLIKNHFNSKNDVKKLLKSYWNSKKNVQKNHDEFAENTISNFYYPLGVAPNFLINNKIFTLPMVTEESSVVAAACKSAKFWFSRGGFKTKVLNTEKVGQIHFLFSGKSTKIKKFFHKNKSKLVNSIYELTKNMNKRGGGLKDLEILNKTNLIKNYYQLKGTFETDNAMGANFINSCLEKLAESFKILIKDDNELDSNEKNIEIIMSILSNYTPNCIVKAKVSCPINKLGPFKNMKEEEFAKKFLIAIKIAKTDEYRAVTHNKGIMNGIDAIAMATGNDFRAIEACVHAYACRSGKYSSLSNAFIKNKNFIFEIELPLSMGTVGGLTKLHPIVNWSLELLNFPDSKSLMEITAVAGLAQNFAAIKSLITSGIQKGHMKMHLLNILKQKGASENQKIKAINFFKKNIVSVSAVEDFLKNS